MFTWAGSTFDQILNGYVISVVARLTAAITPLALSVMTVWVALFGWAVVRGEIAESIPAFLWKVTKISLVLAIALQSGTYIETISESANGLAVGVASTFLPALVDASTITSPYGLLDAFFDQASTQISDLMREAGIFRLDLLFAAIVFSAGTAVYLCIGLFVVTLAKVFLTFIIAVGPIFVLCLAWKPTARFFDGWLSMVLNAIVLTWFAFFALGLSTFLGQSIFQAIATGGGFLGGNFNVLAEATRYCILMLLMAIICFQAPSLASALTGGAAIQQGVQMMQSAMMASGLRSSSANDPGTGAQGGSITSAAIAARLFSSSAQGGAGGQKQSATAKTAAYKLAALRGRT